MDPKVALARAAIGEINSVVRREITGIVIVPAADIM